MGWPAAILLAEIVLPKYSNCEVSYMTAGHDQSPPLTATEQDFIIYRVINEHFRQDVREFWVCSNFYLLVQAGLISVFVATGSSPTMHTDARNKTAHPS